MTQFTRNLASLCLCCLTGCAARAMDLDHAAPGSAGSGSTDATPTAVVSNDEFDSVWVDEQRLYWLARNGFVSRLQSCLKADCEHTKQTYMESTQQVQSTVADGRVYWTTNLSLFSCAAEGCQSKPTKVGQDPAAGASPLFAHRDYVYWSSDFDIYRCPAQGCGETPEVVALNANAGRLVFDDKRAYWVDDYRRILSVPSDGSEPPKVEASNVPDGDPIDSLAIGAGYLYWAAGERVFRCPNPGCDASTPTLLVTADAHIIELEVDDSTLYWLENHALHSCPLSGCEKSLTLTPPNLPGIIWNGSDVMVPFAIDASNLYWIDRDTPLPKGGQSIRTIPK